MFDIGFSELVLVFIVGLVVLGPQRMPVAIRTVMKWVRTIRGLAANVQNELAQELKLQELQESIKKAEHLNLKSLSPELAQTVEELKQSADKMRVDLEQQANAANKSLEEHIKDVREANFAEVEQHKDDQSAVNFTAEKTAENTTALDTELTPAEQAEQAEISLDEQLAKYMDQYHPTDDVQPTVANPTPEKNT
ncbi:Sec-independent protein translocase protein TatB [Actinobacillus porcinus]|uniref:Sec-independent protein translocase protein TatB n=1 Tax=Actinobacillus porcinus TaxID=51048 RepID=A0ABY6TI99_9PAST|nr:Sec-independent protein translocase protein TatB [Actinobacillus porcinus]VFY92486.1 sec-independent translocase [Actinobacillus porcinus]VTU06488.1 sec-independent translocase [Actinobacillus porcinus]